MIKGLVGQSKTRKDDLLPTSQQTRQFLDLYGENESTGENERDKPQETTKFAV